MRLRVPVTALPLNTPPLKNPTNKTVIGTEVVNRSSVGLRQEHQEPEAWTKVPVMAQGAKALEVPFFWVGEGLIFRWGKFNLFFLVDFPFFFSIVFFF